LRGAEDWRSNQPCRELPYPRSAIISASQPSSIHPAGRSSKPSAPDRCCACARGPVPGCRLGLVRSYRILAGVSRPARPSLQREWGTGRPTQRRPQRGDQIGIRHVCALRSIPYGQSAFGASRRVSLRWLEPPGFPQECARDSRTFGIRGEREIAWRSRK